MKKQMTLFTIALLLSSNAFGMSGAEQQFHEALRLNYFDQAESILRGMRKRGEYRVASELEKELTNVKIQYYANVEKGINPDMPAPGEFPPAPQAPEAPPMWMPQQPVGDVYAHIKAILAKQALGMVDKATLNMELGNPNLPQELREQINAKLSGGTLAAPAFQDPMLAKNKNRDKFEFVRDVLTSDDALNAMSKGALERALQDPELPEDLRMPIQYKLQGIPLEQVPLAPQAPAVWMPQQPVGDVYAHIKAILAKPALGMVDQAILNNELKNPNLPQELRDQINAKLSGGASAPAFQDPMLAKQQDKFAFVRNVLQDEELGMIGRNALEKALQDPELPADLRMQAELKLGRVPTPPKAPPAPPAPGMAKKVEGKFNWAQDAQGNWIKVPVAE